MQLTFDADVETFRAEFVAFLDEHLPVEAQAAERPSSTSHVPEWSRRWQRLQFDHGWLLPGNPPEFGGRNANILQQFVHREELSRRRIYHCFNPQGVGIIAASLLSFGTEEQKQRWAVPILRADKTASLGMSEPGAGSDLAGLRTKAELVGDHFVVNGQKVWTSGAHDADVILTFVRTDPDAPRHKGISALLIPTETPGVQRRPFASVYDPDELDFNEVFFNDVRVPADNLVGPLNGGWRVANGSLGHERTLMWMAFANRLEQLLEDYRPADELNADHYATIVMDYYALRLLGSAALGRAARGDVDVAALSVLKVFGSEAEQSALRHALDAAGADGLRAKGLTAQYNPYAPDLFTAGWFARYISSYAGTIAGGTSEIQRNIIAQRVLGLPAR
ncbi:acyl-CoA dehydrogenase family protein [Mycobacterium paraintracellulare]|uniref:Acyl-CoA dehydrogenase n=1 Tax=Mycobacterium paraintracellulare TaxID=1138383 RepID=A0ABN6AR42_9MYCO|nr:acyl-CoA dehydrogenase family protein [Mycobacterium paraintracellulare]AFC52318.1 acyl-CoA dehydrogenase domain-containing protein [Mycobacterium paraintracellulare]OSC29623.1 acyl-CoA dehydrogenase [Mycobacterium paraintracellulare]BBY70491.1 acyl-CoA dehydrogenase [Mycobacterium paraintracellulare]